jgi:hypothetical protein
LAGNRIQASFAQTRANIAPMRLPHRTTPTNEQPIVRATGDR